MALQPTQETWEIPGTVELQTILFESKEQMLTWRVLSYRIYRDKNQTQRKSRGKNKEWQ